MSIDPISRAELAERRRRFQAQLGEGVAIVPGAHARTRSHDTEYPFRQDSDLWYLTGFEQPEAVAVFTQGRFMFFVQPRDPVMETWNGRRPGVEGAVSRFGADEAFPIGELAAKLPGLLENKPRLWHTFARDRALDDLVTAALADVRARGRRGVTAPSEIALAARPDPRDAAAQVERRARDHARGVGDLGRGAPLRGARLQGGHARVRARGRAPARVPQARRAGAGLQPDRRHGRQRDHPPLRREPRCAPGRAARADRRGGRATRLCVGRDARLSGRRRASRARRATCTRPCSTRSTRRSARSRRA